MGKMFFDFDDNDFADPISKDLATDSEGNLMLRISDTLAMDMETGDCHDISGWPGGDED